MRRESAVSKLGRDQSAERLVGRCRSQAKATTEESEGRGEENGSTRPMPSQKVVATVPWAALWPQATSPNACMWDEESQTTKHCPGRPSLRSSNWLVGPKSLRVRGRPGRRAAGAEIKRKAAQAELHSQLSNSHFQRHPMHRPVG